MRRQAETRWHPKGRIILLTSVCALVAALIIVLFCADTGNNVYPFRGVDITLSDGWTLTDGTGASREVSLPVTVPCTGDGTMTLRRTLPAAEPSDEPLTLAYYANYLDVAIALDGDTRFAFPTGAALVTPATGNTWHYLPLPSDFGGREVTISLRCQLGTQIPYTLYAPRVGLLAAMMERSFIGSLPLLVLVSCMLLLALLMFVLFLALRGQTYRSDSSLYMAFFLLIFAAYVFCETDLAHRLCVNSHALYAATLMLLALTPIPLIGHFARDVSERFDRWVHAASAVCYLNLLSQIALHFMGVSNLRVTLTMTHVTLVLTIVVMSVCLLRTRADEHAGARRRLLEALPMALGGIADIALLWLDLPSANNSMWFTTGVLLFCLFQLTEYVLDYFRVYRASVERDLLREVAFIDMLTGIGNRNAYESRLRDMSDITPDASLGCIVLDINDLKAINDTCGHAAGDAAIVETGRILAELKQRVGTPFRTGGDEFVVLTDGLSEEKLASVADTIRAAGAGFRCGGGTLDLAIGWGCFEPADGNVQDFIRRVDTRMYEDKRRIKGGKGCGC